MPLVQHPDRLAYICLMMPLNTIQGFIRHYASYTPPYNLLYDMLLKQPVFHARFYDTTSITQKSINQEMSRCLRSIAFLGLLMQNVLICCKPLAIYYYNCTKLNLHRTQNICEVKMWKIRSSYIYTPTIEWT